MQESCRPFNTRNLVTGLLIALLSLVAGCSHPAVLLGLKDGNYSPRIRMSSYATASVGTVWVDPNEIGEHGYARGETEGNGILYTCRGGHIDTPHVRKAADWTAYLAWRAVECLIESDTQFSFKLWEPSRYYVTFEYPPGWEYLSAADKEKIAREIAIPLGEYLSFAALTWHEILTWFGYGPTPWYPQFPSAFSWEDTFSNLLGARLGAQAMRDPDRSYNEAMTVLFDEELRRLGAQPREVAIRASKSVKGTWYTGRFLFVVNIKKRDLDIGLEDGFVTPSLVPSVPECPDAEPISYPVPTLDYLADYGFSVKVEIEPREWQKGKILRIVYPDRATRKKRLQPALHFPIIMDTIREDAIRKFGPTLYPDPQTQSPKTPDSPIARP